MPWMKKIEHSRWANASLECKYRVQKEMGGKKKSKCNVIRCTNLTRYYFSLAFSIRFRLKNGERKKLAFALERFYLSSFNYLMTFCIAFQIIQSTGGCPTVLNCNPNFKCDGIFFPRIIVRNKIPIETKQSQILNFNRDFHSIRKSIEQYIEEELPFDCVHSICFFFFY